MIQMTVYIDSENKISYKKYESKSLELLLLSLYFQSKHQTKLFNSCLHHWHGKISRSVVSETLSIGIMHL